MLSTWHGFVKQDVQLCIVWSEKAKYFMRFDFSASSFSHHRTFQTDSQWAYPMSNSCSIVNNRQQSQFYFSAHQCSFEVIRWEAENTKHRDSCCKASACEANVNWASCRALINHSAKMLSRHKRKTNYITISLGCTLYLMSTTKRIRATTDLRRWT